MNNGLPKGWRTTTLGDCAQCVSGGTPSKLKPENWIGTIPWLSAKDIKSFRIYDTEDHISDEAARDGTTIVPKGTILVLVRGMTLHNDVPICIAMRDTAFNQDVKGLRPYPDVDSNFLAYALLAGKPFLRSCVDSASHGTGRIHTDVLRSFPLALPSISDQRAIAQILGTLDDKIELNRRMNETLEQIARAIFKSWFVDFDPVRAKSEGRRPPGLDPQTAALFPDSFAYSPVGPIPKEWKVGVLRDLVGFQSGYAFRSKDWQESGIPVVKIGSVKPGFVDLTQVSYVSDAVATEAQQFRLGVGDLLIGMTGYVGEVGLVPPTSYLPLLNQRVGKLIPNRPGTERLGFVYCMTRDADFKTSVEQRSHGTAQANVSASAILDIPTIVPAENERKYFDGFCKPLLDRMLNNRGQTDTLGAIRDALLPKLLSGEIRIRDAARVVETSL